MFFSIIVVFDRLSSVFTAFFTYVFQCPRRFCQEMLLLLLYNVGLFFFLDISGRIVIRVIKKNKFHLSGSFCGHMIAYRPIRRLYTICMTVKLILFENSISVRSKNVIRTRIKVFLIVNRKNFFTKHFFIFFNSFFF